VSLEVFQFGEYKLDCGRFELLREGRSLRLERKPMELLILLASRRGELVSREEIAERLWGREVFVDSEHGINTAIRKVRYALRDQPERPRFIQTVTGKGYRFAGVIEAVEEEVFLPEARNGSHPEARAAVSDAEVTTELEPQSLPHADETRGTGKRRFSAWLGVAGVAAVVAAVILIARALEARNHSEDGAALAQIHSVAVLPLENRSGDPAQDYFASGMTDELTSMLARDSTLRVIAGTREVQSKEGQKPLREIARELGVDGIVRGSVERSGGKVRMALELVPETAQGPSDGRVWTASYDRDADDVVSLPGDAAMAIAEKTDSAVAVRKPLQHVNPAAHDAYLHGRYLWIAGRNEEAEQYFSRAVALQPDYALAWTGVADYYGQGMVLGQMDPREANQPFLSAAEKAVELDGSLAQAHNTLCAALFFTRWDLEGANRECLRAIELDPEFAEAYHLRAKVLIALNRDQEAIASQKKAMELDPFARSWGLAYIYLLARQYDAGITEGQQRLESDPHNRWTLHILSMLYRCKGMYAESAKALEQGLIADGDDVDATSVRHAFERGGYRAVILWGLANLKKRAQTHYVAPSEMALQYAQLGDREKTLSLLEEAYRQHSPMLLESLQTDPAYDFLHKDPRYRALVQKIGLPPAY